MAVPPKKIYRIREVSELLDIPSSTLRYWEDCFDIFTPKRTASGQRRYTDKDIEVCREIIRLLRDKGLSIEYTNRELAKYRKYPPHHTPICKSVQSAIKLLNQVRDRTEDTHIIAKIESVISFLSTPTKTSQS